MAPQNYLRSGPGGCHVFNTTRPFLTNPGRDKNALESSPTIQASATPVRLSVVVITLNEAQNLPRMLDSVRGLADEVVVFDSGSTDETVTIAEAHGARVSSCAWEGWSSTKNSANQAAQGKWILSLDADEALTEEAREAIRRHTAGPIRSENGDWRVGEINRLTNYCGQWVRHSGWHPDRKIRLWPTGSAQWEGAIHERPRFDGPIEVTRIAGKVEHHSYPSASDHLEQIERFGRVWAEDRFSRGLRAPMTLVLLKVVAQWLKSFVIRLGFLDGRTGWTIARRSAWATWRKHARLHLLHRGGPPTPSRVLISRTDALGDLVVTLPLVRALKDRFPGVVVDLIVRGYAVPVARQAQGVGSVLEWTDAMAERPSGMGAEILREGRYDAMVHAFPDPDVMRAAKHADIPMRMASGRRWHGLRYATHRSWDSRRNSGGHEAWHGLRLLLPLGVETDGGYRGRIGLVPPDGEGPLIDILTHMGHAPILLHPGSNGSAGNWPPARFAELASRLADEGHAVGVTGTAAERESFAPYLPDHPRVMDLYGRLDLTQLMALQFRSALVVASSTGPLHTAAALGTPCVGLYGPDAPEWPQRWAPLGPSVRLCVARTRTEEGQLDLSVEEVLDACLNDLNAPDPGA